MADLLNTFVREIEIFDTTLEIHQASIGDVGCVVWDAAIVLAKYLEKTRRRDLKSKKILELGAGTGMISLCCSLISGTDVVCTDLKELQSLIELNMNVNKKHMKGTFKYSELKWGENLTSFDCVDILIMSDVIYYEESLKPLTDTIYYLTDENTEVLVSYEERYDGNKLILRNQFFKTLEKDFAMLDIPVEDQDEIFQSSDIRIVSMKRKPS